MIEKIIQELIKKRIKTRADLDCFKRRMSKKHKINCLSNMELISAYHELIEKGIIQQNDAVEKLLRVRPVRSLSGIVNVSVLTKPYPCPGKCVFCPQEKDIPKSYLSGEPAVDRAKILKFNPYLQVQKRIQALELGGHPIDKIELRIIGGTWSYYPRPYQKYFIRRCFQACNEFSLFRNPKSQIPNPKQIHWTRSGLSGGLHPKPKNLKKEQKRNEKAKCRIVGITVETRPDFVDAKEIKQMRALGITRVELGAQSIYNNVLRASKREHNIESTVRATRLLKNAGFKVSYQIMPNLPKSNLKKDIEMFCQLFSNPDFKPDLLKIYPLALVKNSPLYRLYKKGEFKPYSKKQLLSLLVEIKQVIPYYARVERIIRDIPSKDIVEGGAKVSNLREFAQKEIKSKGKTCKCIRCREVRENYSAKEKIEMFRCDYKASEGLEIFLSFENKKRTKLYALLRLRIPAHLGVRHVSDTCLTPNVRRFILPVLKGSAIIREVHTYGQMASINKSASLNSYGYLMRNGSVQHKGLGRKLIKQAENIAKQEFNLPKIAVISAAGTRGYYRKLGYRLKNTYMLKKL